MPTTVTSSEVLAWLKEHAAASGIPGLELIATTNGCGYIASMPGIPVGESASTVEAAVDKLRMKLLRIAQHQRDEASKLIASAQALYEKP